ncbi:hypothetical protein AVEN_49581-1 [Araneus ventricosus]|uniref:Uncharacterized protein n=1 Tax=Araneus ventricosus TaxID=182803 RepID=A0A4Y2J458_ARAVE|nr:hypothetical protein AVEN_49581-1 [Araneus ventricosus]
MAAFPKDGKQLPTVVPILKPDKDPTQPSSYRPISLLFSLSKIAEDIILNRLNKFLTDNNILCPEQFAFKPKLSTLHRLVRVTEFITEGFTNNQKNRSSFPRHPKSVRQSLTGHTHTQTLHL